MILLQDLTNKYHAMKPPSYLRVYERMFAHRRDFVKSVLEIGIQGGGSLRLWRDYFPRAHVYGMDIVDFKISEPRVTTIIGDQSSAADLARAAALGPFDVVIDDGSHRPAHWLASHRALAGRVKPGGFYVIEDLRSAERQDIYSPEDLAQMVPAVREIVEPMMRLHGSMWDWFELHQHMLVMHRFDPEESAQDEKCWWERGEKT